MASWKAYWIEQFNIRETNIRRLGFKSYGEYLKSDLWKAIRKDVLDRAERKCSFCCRRACQVHHKQYDIDTLTGFSLNRLQAVCDPCHKRKTMHSRIKRKGEEYDPILPVETRGLPTRRQHLLGDFVLTSVEELRRLSLESDGRPLFPLTGRTE